jgi:outer membrane lipoprotein-sorting protein
MCAVRHLFSGDGIDTVRPCFFAQARHFLRQLRCAIIDSPSSTGDFFTGENSLQWKHAKTLLALWLLACAAPGVIAANSRQGHSNWTWPAVREQLDREAKDFHSLSADMERTKVTVVVNDRSTETGGIFVRGDKMLLQFKAPDQRTILRTGDNLYIYNPGLKRVEEYSLGKNRALVEQFLQLGFGSRGSELEKDYDVKLLPEERIDNQPVVVLSLIPKSPQVLHEISKIEIWLNETTWLPVQQEFFEAGSGDYSIVKYSNIVRNPNIPDSRFRPNWPKGTQKVKLQT